MLCTLRLTLIWDEIISVLAKVTQVSDVAHGPLVEIDLHLFMIHLYTKHPLNPSNHH
jgi:hypothetical protein